MMNLLEKLDNIEVTEVKPATKAFPPELYKHIEGLHAHYALKHRVLLKSYLPLDADLKEILAASNQGQQLTESEKLALVMTGNVTIDADAVPYDCVRAIHEARNTLGSHIDSALYSFIQNVESHVRYQHPLVKDLFSLQGLSPFRDSYLIPRKWHQNYRNDVVLPELCSHDVLDINCIFEVLEASVGGMSLVELDRKKTLDEWESFIGVHSDRPRNITLAKKKSYGKVVRFALLTSYYLARPRLDYFAEMLGYFEKSTWGEPLESMYKNDRVNGVFAVPETWKLVKEVKIFENGNVAIKFKDGHTAARFVREICKRDPDTCQ